MGDLSERVTDERLAALLDIHPSNRSDEEMRVALCELIALRAKLPVYEAAVWLAERDDEIAKECGIHNSFPGWSDRLLCYRAARSHSPPSDAAGATR